MHHYVTFTSSTCTLYTHHGRNGKVATVKLLRKKFDFTARVAENHGLCDGQRLIEVAECVQLPLLALHLNVELANTYTEYTNQVNSNHCINAYRFSRTA